MGGHYVSQSGSLPRVVSAWGLTFAVLFGVQLLDNPALGAKSRGATLMVIPSGTEAPVLRSLTAGSVSGQTLTTSPVETLDVLLPDNTSIILAPV